MLEHKYNKKGVWSMKCYCKVTWTDGQCRITIPKIMVKEVGLESIGFVVLEENGNHQIKIRKIVDEKTYKG
jgi:hypothetical protein